MIRTFAFALAMVAIPAAAFAIPRDIAETSRDRTDCRQLQMHQLVAEDSNRQRDCGGASCGQR